MSGSWSGAHCQTHCTRPQARREWPKSRTSAASSAAGASSHCCESIRVSGGESFKPVEFTIEYDYSEISKVNDEDAKTKDFSISVENSINEFVDLLDIKHKDKVKAYITELYHKAQTNT